MRTGEEDSSRGAAALDSSRSEVQLHEPQRWNDPVPVWVIDAHMALTSRLVHEDMWATPAVPADVRTLLADAMIHDLMRLRSCTSSGEREKMLRAAWVGQKRSLSVAGDVGRRTVVHMSHTQAGTCGLVTF